MTKNFPSVICPLVIILIWGLAPPYNFVQEGAASYYSNTLQGNPTASGAPYHADSLTAAHRYLPLGTSVVVINPANQRQVTVTINDRGPFHSQRIVDLSYRAADSLGIIESGLADVIIKAQLDPEIAKQVEEKLSASAEED